MTLNWINDTKSTLKMLIVWFFNEIDLINFPKNVPTEQK